MTTDNIVCHECGQIFSKDQIQAGSKKLKKHTAKCGLICGGSAPWVERSNGHNRIVNVKTLHMYHINNLECKHTKCAKRRHRLIQSNVDSNS